MEAHNESDKSFLNMRVVYMTNCALSKKYYLQISNFAVIIRLMQISKPKFHKVLSAFLFFSIFFSAWGVSKGYALEKDAFFYLLDGQFLGGYSKIIGKDGIASTDDSWSISPNVKIIKDVLYWINIYNGSYNRSSQVTPQEEGGQQTESTQSHTLTTALKYFINKNWSIRPLFFTDWVFINETEDETFGNGLYDYRDIGGGLESTWVLHSDKTGQDQLVAGFRSFDRSYPNYTSLLSQFDTRAQVTEEHEKDLTGYKYTLGYENQHPGQWSWGIEEILLYKDFHDKRTIAQNGVRSQDDRRQDYENYLNLYIGHPLNSVWRWRLDGQVSFNLSNLDFYDTHNTTTLSDDTFISGYFDYTSFMVGPSLTYEKEIAKDKNLIVTGAYAFSPVFYSSRKVQNAAGIYQDENETDYIHTFSGQVSFPLTKYVSWVTKGSYTIADSNQEYEAFYLYSYDSWSALTGFSLKY